MVEKIDVFGETVFIYNELGVLIKKAELAPYLIYNNGYLENSYLFTINVSKPEKRAVKFVHGDLYPRFFVYDQLSTTDQNNFDNFLNAILNLP